MVVAVQLRTVRLVATASGLVAAPLLSLLHLVTHSPSVASVGSAVALHWRPVTPVAAVVGCLALVDTSAVSRAVGRHPHEALSTACSALQVPLRVRVTAHSLAWVLVATAVRLPGVSAVVPVPVLVVVCLEPTRRLRPTKVARAGRVEIAGLRWCECHRSSTCVLCVCVCVSVCVRVRARTKTSGRVALSLAN